MALYNNSINDVYYVVMLSLAIFTFVTGAESLPELFGFNKRNRNKISQKDRSFFSIFYNPQYYFIAVATFFSLKSSMGLIGLMIMIFVAYVMYKPPTPRHKPKLSGFWTVVAVLGPLLLELQPLP